MSWLLYGALLVVALLYAAVGHAGASGYIAVMTLYGLPPEAVRPMALTLNVAVAVIATVTFWRAGHMRWRLVLPLLLAGPAAAFIGGAVALPSAWFHTLLGAVLLASAARLFFGSSVEQIQIERPLLPALCAVGAALGLLAGLTGTGGGVFLTPLLIFLGWARAQEAAAASAVFILVNSVAGLGGLLVVGGQIPREVLPMLAVVAVGGAVGSSLGARRLRTQWIGYLLGMVLLIAGLKLVWI